MSFTCEKPCECPVCFEPLNEDKSLSCGHWVHKNCIIRSKKDTCPLCRKQVELTLEEKDELFRLKVQDIIQTQYIEEDHEEEDYFNEHIYIQDEDEEDLPYTMPAENTIVTLYLSVMFRVEDEAILYDGRVISTVGNRVKIEFSVRSLKDPSAKRNMNSLLFTHFPNDNYLEQDYEILTILPQRTLIEKMLLLHEEYNRDEFDKMRTDRMSRHYYDLYQLSKQDFTQSTLTDDAFIGDIINHRIYYSRLKRFDYNTLKRGSLKLIPSSDILDALRKDYEIMRAEMIYGEPPSFEEIIIEVQGLQEVINKIN